MLISKATHDLLEGEYNIRPIDLVEVKGKHEAVEIFEVICANKEISDSELRFYADATAYFREGDVLDALKIYEELQKTYPCKLYAFYIERCERFLKNPDLDFTAVLTMTTK